MKKIITLALACIMAFALTACSGNGDTDKVPEKPGFGNSLSRNFRCAGRK